MPRSAEFVSCESFESYESSEPLGPLEPFKDGVQLLTSVPSSSELECRSAHLVASGIYIWWRATGAYSIKTTYIFVNI